MAKEKQSETAVAEPAPGEFGPITADEYFALPEEVRMRRAKRAYEKFLALKGTIHLDLDIDELRGRNLEPKDEQ